MEIRVFGKVITVTPDQFRALLALLTVLYTVARAFGVVDVGGVPVV